MLRVGVSTTTARFHDDDSVLRFHGDNSVEGGWFHSDDSDPNDGSVEGGQFYGDDPNPTDA
jgi:hypothetical protein